MVAVPCCRSACCLRYCQAYHPPLSVMATVEPGGPGSIGVNRAGAFTRTGMAPTLPHPFGPPTRGLNAARVHGVRRFLARSISIHVTVGVHGVRRVLARRAWLYVRRRVVVRGVDHHPFDLRAVFPAAAPRVIAVEAGGLLLRFARCEAWPGRAELTHDYRFGHCILHWKPAEAGSGL